jgi:hypothetical protein
MIWVIVALPSQLSPLASGLASNAANWPTSSDRSDNAPKLRSRTAPGGSGPWLIAMVGFATAIFSGIRAKSLSHNRIPMT